MADPLPRYAKVQPDNPEAFAQCDRCGFWYNRGDLAWQYEWAGTHLYNTGKLVCTVGNKCIDKPFEQLRTIILPPDPPPVLNARTVDFVYEEQTPRIIQFAQGTWINNQYAQGLNAPSVIRATQLPSIASTNNGEYARVLQYQTAGTEAQPGVNEVIDEEGIIVTVTE